ncbi:electron transport complex subunit RsxB [Inmirania thermothiophila]|uniref:Ion-translocating oxidoreductase complex subunit B n=1 Tax=Inmirania thermothiophila TaxID=1750597 RepID=A0A3N1Y8F3_9GAMM|nr:electron transport complex subunit RsxB [Inmirania thermothiophila]ROR35055.1 electron transport complex protein RnfB [Inmirania thermothiophila]
MIVAVASLTVLALGFGLLLGYADLRFRVEGDPVADQVDGLLPQTQCGQCGYPGCRPYAEAVAAGEAEINLCIPGGEPVMRAIADLLGREPKPVEEAEEKGPEVAVIDEQNCIGCTKCILVCPVDAIVGATKQMHTVIRAECTGCEKCVPACPVECIRMEPVDEGLAGWRWPRPAGIGEAA